MRLSDISQEVIDEYKLMENVTADGHVVVEVRRGVYRLQQAGINTHDLLEKRLNKTNYYQSEVIPSVWTHKTRSIQFTLVVDNFGLKYTREEDAKHLMSVLEEYYDILTDWHLKKYMGLTLDWDYQGREFHLSIGVR